jgi:hypothetical protein
MTGNLVVGLINLFILIVVLTLTIRSLSKNTEKFNNSGVGVSKYIVDVSEEHMEFVLSNVKLGQYKYLTVIQHRPFNINGRLYHPIGQLSIITEEIKPQQSEFIHNAIKNSQSAHMCASHQVFPTDYQEVWNTSYMLEPISEVFSIWRPVVPDGHISLSDLIVRGRQKPPLNSITCVPVEDTVTLSSSNQIQWNDNNIECHNVGSNFTSCKTTNNEPIIVDLKINVAGLSISDEKNLHISASSVSTSN